MNHNVYHATVDANAFTWCIKCSSIQLPINRMTKDACEIVTSGVLQKRLRCAANLFFKNTPLVLDWDKSHIDDDAFLATPIVLWASFHNNVHGVVIWNAAQQVRLSVGQACCGRRHVSPKPSRNNMVRASLWTDATYSLKRHTECEW